MLPLSPSLLGLNEDILLNIVYHLVQPPMHEICSQTEEREPNLLPFFSLAMTCKSLRQLLIRPDSDDAYWRQLMLDSGSGRPCEQEAVSTGLLLRSPAEVIGLTSMDSDWSWAEMASRQANMESRGRNLQLYYGQGIPVSVVPTAPSEWYSWVPGVIGPPLREFYQYMWAFDLRL